MFYPVILRRSPLGRVSLGTGDVTVVLVLNGQPEDGVPVRYRLNQGGRDWDRTEQKLLESHTEFDPCRPYVVSKSFHDISTWTGPGPLSP